MIIASDLDRTLIYSNRAMDELGRPADLLLKPVENREGRWVSFMTKSSFKSLERLCQDYLFVPITTRTIEQYKRICIFRQELTPRYAVTSNGANILLQGERVIEWSEYLFSKMRTETATMDEINFLLQKEFFIFEGKRKQVDDLFFYYILNTTLKIEDKVTITNLLAPFGWNVSLQGRKLYFIPKVINKGDALAYICSHHGESALAGSGDSILDWDFLKHCRYRIVPNHGELASDLSNFSCPGVSVTKNGGVLAGEEILNSFLSF